MKKVPLLTIFLTIHTMAGASDVPAQQAGEATEKPKISFSERISEDELVRLRSLPQSMTGSSPAQVVTTAASGSFADTSDFITFNGISTFVPKGAVLHVPESLRPNMVAGSGSKLVLWNDFLLRFPAIVERFDVSIQEAAGAQKINSDRLAAARRSDHIIVTVIGGNPTSTCESKDNPSKVSK